MVAKELENELKRMFKSLGGRPNKNTICEEVICSECPFNVKEQSLARCILNFAHIDEVIDIVTAWSAENPKKTNKDVFLKAFPNAKTDDRGTPKLCAMILGIVDGCAGCCSECWNEEYNGADIERLRGEAE